MKADNTKTTIRQIIILLLAFGAFTGLFFLLFEVQEEQVDKGFKPIAQSNPYHAATLFLNQTGIRTTVIKGFKEIENLSQMDGTIIITDSRKHLSQNQNKELLNWVKKGGSLILFAELPKVSSSWLDAFTNDSDKTHQSDLILSTVGARVYKPESDASDDQAEENPESPTECENMSKLAMTACAKLRFRGINKPLLIEFSTRTFIEDKSKTANASVGSENGLHLLQYDLGDGLLTLVTDLNFWTNHKIQKNDHAYLLESFTENSNHVWFMSQGRSLSFLELIWKYAHFLIGWFVLGLALFLWRKSYRFGPILPGYQASSRKLMEHITASSRFLWRNKKESYMVQQLQDYIDRRMQKKQPGYKRLSQTERIEAIHRVTHQSRPDIHQAYQSRERYTKSEFLKTIKALQMIGKKL